MFLLYKTILWQQFWKSGEGMQNAGVSGLYILIILREPLLYSSLRLGCQAYLMHATNQTEIFVLCFSPLSPEGLCKDNLKAWEWNSNTAHVPSSDRIIID